MPRPPDHMNAVSERLSEVMNEIGVNETLVMKRRRAYMVMENIELLSYDDHRLKFYYFGSQSEASTTFGLNSDIDSLVNMNIFYVIQNMSEWKPLKVFLSKMIQNDNISPGYCYLQCIRSDIPLPATVNDIDNGMMLHCVTDSDGRLLLENTFITSPFYEHISHEDLQRHGPALTRLEDDESVAADTVTSFCCESSPHQVTSWLQKQRECKWPTEDVGEDCTNVGCFVVPVGSKVAYIPELEWRISTSLQERYLMFSLNITQLRCLVLMKMILKTYIEPHVEDVLSSFMCKNVLWYCIANSSHDWHTGNLLSYLHLCLFMLKECVEQRNCPHFMMPDNNLLAGGMTNTQRGNLLDIINNLMKNDKQFLYEIQIDDLGRRLKMRLNMLKDDGLRFLSSRFISYNTVSNHLVFQIAGSLNVSINMVLLQTSHGSLVMVQNYFQLTASKLERDKNAIKHEHLETSLQYLSQELTNLERHRREGDFYRRTASALLTPFVSSTLGSVIASTNIASRTTISDEAFTYLEAGKESDALSGRLKLVSVLYCTGDMERAEIELSIIETQYNISEVCTACRCTTKICTPPIYKLGYVSHQYECDDYNETVIKSNIALCTRFLQCEINCVPHELRYEILRSYIEEDRKMRLYQDRFWMDFIVVDSIPYLHFLQYKIYGHLMRRTDQQIALTNLALTIDFESGLGHKDTALNLLGQCMEQENRPTEAIQCYILSLQHRERNNAARFLLCMQLFNQQHNSQ